MNIEFVRNRIAFLRTAKNISARELSLRLGQSVGYINHIEIGTSNPSVEMLFYICEELKLNREQNCIDLYKHVNQENIDDNYNFDDDYIETLYL